MQIVKIQQNYMVATPAYGRDYKSGKAAKEDFLAGKDFLLHDHRGSAYGSISDFCSGVVVNIRYNKNQKILPVTVP